MIQSSVRIYIKEGEHLSSTMTTLLVHPTSHFLRFDETKETDDGSEFGDRHISPAQKNGLSLQKTLKVIGEMGFCLVNVESNHVLLLN